MQVFLFAPEVILYFKLHLNFYSQFNKSIIRFGKRIQTSTIYAQNVVCGLNSELPSGETERSTLILFQ